MKDPESITVQIPSLSLRAAVDVATADDAKRTVDLIWSTGAAVERSDYWTGKRYIEKLSMKAEHIRLDRLNAGAPFLDSHSSDSVFRVLGVIESAEVVGGKGRARVRFSERAEVEPVWRDVRGGIIRNVSVGYKVHRFEEVAGKGDAPAIRTATDWEPYEISAVPMGADPGARTRSGEQSMNACVITRSAEEGEMEPEKVETKPEPVPAQRITLVEQTPEEARDVATRAERERADGIRKIVRGVKLPEAFADGLVGRGLNLDQARAATCDELARISTTHEPAPGRVVVGEDEADKRRRGIGAWVLSRSGVDALVRQAAKKRPEHSAFANVSADPAEFRGFSLLEMARETLERSGVSTRGMDKMAIAGLALRGTASNVGAQTTSDFAVALENTLNKVLLAAYVVAPDTWRRFCAVGSLSDFRAHPRYRTGYLGTLDVVREGAEFKNKNVPDANKESITATTKGNILSLSRQAIINDDMGVFSRMATQAGRAAALTIEADVYALLALNSGLGPAMNDAKTLFHADHDNIGDPAALTVAALDADRVTMALQTDPAGNEILDLRPAILVVPAGYEGTARVINDAEYDTDATSGTGRTDRTPNKVRGLYRDIVGTGRMTGTRWYSFADPAEMPVIEVAFLDGQQEPFLEVQEGWRIDGAEWKVRIDYAVGAIEVRGAVTNTGVEST